jgi:mevalonate kinase
MALDSDSQVWLDGILKRTEGGWKASDEALEPVAHLLNASEKISQRILPGGQVRTRLEFPSNYGWGSSSTLISLVAQWQEIDALSLHFATQNGSGYDAICATAKGPMWYWKTADQTAEWESTSLAHWPHDSLYLVHLGHKQQSAADVVRYRLWPQVRRIWTGSSTPHARCLKPLLLTPGATRHGYTKPAWQPYWDGRPSPKEL